jgi:hypothetical protein
MASDQRYCLQCGERRAMSSVLMGGSPTAATSASPPAAPPSQAAPEEGGSQRGSGLIAIAGVGVLLLAMGVGVLIGRSGGSRTAVAPQQVISVATSPAAGSGGAVAGEASFSDDWPAGTRGFTVQLQTLPVPGGAVNAVKAAKAAAATKGAKGVGALKSEDFASLPAGRYVIYSGVYHKKAEAERALSGLKKSFPGAGVIEVSNRSPAASGAGSGASGAGGGIGSSITKPAPPTVLKGLSKKGKSYEQESKNLPNVISTG